MGVSLTPFYVIFFPFDPGDGCHYDIMLDRKGTLGMSEVVGLHGDKYSSNISFLSCDYYLVLLLDLMGLNEICLPTWMDYHVLLYLKGDLFLFKCRTIKDLTYVVT